MSINFSFEIMIVNIQKNSLLPGSNQRPQDVLLTLQSRALPTELKRDLQTLQEAHSLHFDGILK